MENQFIWKNGHCPKKAYSKGTFWGKTCFGGRSPATFKGGFLRPYSPCIWEGENGDKAKRCGCESGERAAQLETHKKKKNKKNLEKKKISAASASLASLRPDKSPRSSPAAICIRWERGDRSRCIHEGTLQIRLTKSRRRRQFFCCAAAC